MASHSSFSLSELTGMKSSGRSFSGTIVEAFRIMLRSAGDSDTAKNPMQVAEIICADAGLQGLEEVFYVTLAVSGILGAKTSATMLQQFGLENKDPAPAEQEGSEETEKN